MVGFIHGKNKKHVFWFLLWSIRSPMPKNKKAQVCWVLPLFFCFWALVIIYRQKQKPKNNVCLHKSNQKNNKNSMKTNKQSFRPKPKILLRVFDFFLFWFCFGFGSKFDLVLSPQLFFQAHSFSVFVCARWSASNARIAINGAKTDVYVNSPRRTSSTRRKRL